MLGYREYHEVQIVSETLFRLDSYNTCSKVLINLLLASAPPLLCHPLNPPTDQHEKPIMNRSTPINVSGLSSAIVNTVPNDYEESFTKCKTNKDNHSPRPAHTRYSDLFDQPCSGAQIIIFLTSEPKSFLNLKITEKLTFMNSLTKINGQVKAGTKWTHQGYINTYP